MIISRWLWVFVRMYWSESFTARVSCFGTLTLQSIPCLKHPSALIPILKPYVSALLRRVLAVRCVACMSRLNGAENSRFASSRVLGLRFRV